MYDLTSLTESQISECGARLEAFGPGAPNMEAVANDIVRHIYDSMTDPATGEKACALVRLYKTHLYDKLDAGLQGFADAILGETERPDDMRCLTLLATVGEHADWNSRANSNGHKAIPLPSAEFVGKIPMIARLVSQFGLEVNAVLRPDPAIMVGLGDQACSVFHVPEAVGSPYIPAQDDFVIPYGVRSVVGFGGMLPSGELYVVIMFAKAQVSRDVAERFSAMAAHVKTAIEPFAGKAVFDGD